MRLIKTAKNLRGFLILAILFVWLVPTEIGLTQVDQKYFEETGHVVKGVFLKYFQDHGGADLFGYPLTEEFVDQGVTVQYFQKVRMEWHPNNPEPYQVQLGLLADELRYRRPAAPEPTPKSRRRVYFAETGHSVSYAFLDFFREHGDIDVFGYPITEMYFEDGVIVQYFQRMKLEWYSDDPNATVKVGDLGALYLSIYKDRMLPEALQRVDPRPWTGEATAVPSVTGVRAVVSLKYSVMSKKSSQTVSVLVTDSTGAPIENAQVQVKFETAAGQATMASFSTDARGFGSATIPVTSGETGSQVIVRAEVVYGTLTTNAQNVFLLWW